MSACLLLLSYGVANRLSQITEKFSNHAENTFMQSGETVRNWADIKGIAVVVIENGSKVGTIDDFYFQPQNHGIQALQVKTGLFGHRILPASNITALGRDAVTITNENLLVQEHAQDEITLLPLGRSLLSYRILSENGSFIGTVGNILIDVSTPTQLRVDAYELADTMHTRLTGKHVILSSSHVIRYGQDVIVVTNDVAEALTKH